MLVITGVRRHWILNQLDKYELPYIFIGQKPNMEDDYLKKIPREEILEIIKECDFSIVTSAWEGGPLCIVESLEVEKLTFSTNVGFSKDLLHSDLILSGHVTKDVQRIKKVINSDLINSKLLHDAKKKYKKFKTLDLYFIIKEINLLFQLRSNNNPILRLINKIFLLDKSLSLLENFLRRILCFLKKKIKDSLNYQ